MYNIDLNIIWSSISSIFIFAFPFSLLLSLCAKVTNFFLSMVFGKKEVTL